jgi:hypothetical protein
MPTPTVVQFRRGSTAQNNGFTGAEGEISVDITKGTIRVHDALTVGGHELMKVDLTNSANNAILDGGTY